MRISRWDQKLNTAQSNEVLFLLCQHHLSLCGEGTQADEVRALVERQDIRGLCNYSLAIPGLSVLQYRHLRQVLAFFQKRRDLDIGVDTRAVAWNKAVEAEALCHETNEIFRKYFRGGFHFPLDVESVLYRAQRKISSILGDLPSLSDLKLRFGPGATTQVKKKDASVRRKLAQTFCSSEDAIRLLPELLAELPCWSGVSQLDKSVTHNVTVHRGRVDFVPKTAKTDRTIAVEPMLNQLVQLGIGDFMARRLRHVGIDIRDQTRNQRLACTGSITGALATLDLSSASDTIACGLVESLLPLEWWDFLRSIRTGESSSPDGDMRLQKFSSMGNGFTFPLETLIFYSLAEACCDPSDFSLVSVYGDDIIIPVYAFPLLTKTLTSCGFLVNKDKSFSDGPFRESCGKDYFSGTDVRPCYIKDTLSGQSCFVLHNFYVRTGQPEPAAEILQFLDVSLQIWGPDGYGDGHLLGDYIKIPHHRADGWGGYTFETFTYKRRRAFYKLGADYVYPCYSIYVKDDIQKMPAEDGFYNDDYDVREDIRVAFAEGGRVLRGSPQHSSHGVFRPDRADAVYAMHNGRRYLVDTLPGVDGYKRIKVYVLG